MNKISINIETDGGARASEIIADLRVVAETLYFPMKLVGFWDHRVDMHLCPQEEKKKMCPHKLPQGHADYVDYGDTLQRERDAGLEVMFPHAGVAIFLG